MPCPPRMRGCRTTCRHRQMVEEYRLARHVAEVEREAATGSYAAEVDDYGPIVVFKTWLRQMAGGAA